MKKIVLTNDIYNRKGILILSKGQEIILTKERKEKLDQLGLLDKILSQCKLVDTTQEQIDADSKDFELYKKEINKSIDEISKMMPGLSQGLRKSSDTLEKIIYECKNTLWYNQFKTLVNYNDWLYTHSINTALISGVIGIEFVYQEQILNELILGAFLHDVGMTLLPKKILDKKDKLNDIEITIVRNHCEIGYSMFQETELSEKSSRIILQHHEKNDGTGYPNELKDEDILEEAKIVMISGSLDTATAIRPYKIAKPVDVVLYEMKNNPNIYESKIVNILYKYLNI